MTVENLIKKYNHLKKLAIEGGKTGNGVRDQLIKSDAKRHLKRLLEKFPGLEKKEKPAVSKPTKAKN